MTFMKIISWNVRLSFSEKGKIDFDLICSFKESEKNLSDHIPIILKLIKKG